MCAEKNIAFADRCIRLVKVDRYDVHIFHLQNATEDAGRIGLLIVVAGMMGSVACGLILDKTAKFKWVSLIFSGKEFFHL